MSTAVLSTAPSANWLTPPRNSFSFNSNKSPQTLNEQKQFQQAIQQELLRRNEYETERAKRAIAERRKILTYFPDAGPLRRELYKPHIRFFKAGALYRSRLFRAANRCLTPWSAIQTDRGERQVREMIGETGFYVRSWDGSSQCTKRASAVFQVGTEPAFQIHLDNGEVFQCSGKHAVWCGETSDGRHLSNWQTIGHLIQHVNGLHFRHSAQGWMANYGGGGRLCDALPQSQLEASDARLPTQPDVPSNDQDYLQVDVAASKFAHTRVYQENDHSSIADGQRRLEDLCDRTEAPSARHFALPSFWKNQAALRSEYASGLLQANLGDWIARQRFETSGIAEFLLALDSPSIDGRAIVAIVPIGYQPIVDFTVEDTHCYRGAGIIHHNTGKTQACAFEVSCHLMGVYPPWWEGIRFEQEPIEAWTANISWEKVRDVNQAELCGNPERPEALGTGMLPAERIVRHNYSGHTKNCMDTVVVRHISGGTSLLQFKAYTQGRESFESTAKHLVWLDEECPADVYTACEVRTMTTNGILVLSYTPVLGLTPLTELFENEADRA